VKIVFIDTETTGLNPDRCEIWEIGAILREDGQPDVEYEWQLRPSLKGAEPTGLRIGRYYQRSILAKLMEQSASRTVHPDYEGYPRTDPERRTLASRVAAELAPMLDGAYLVGAVPWFDERFLQRFLAKHSQAATNHYHLVDVETLAAGALRMTPPWGFDDLLAAYGLKYDEADRHTALGDARMARDLYDAVLGRGQEQ
jgi:DNA polymerase III epsilon subunit-like protein